MELLRHYVKPGLILVLLVCIALLVFRCILLVYHSGRLKTLNALRGNKPSTTEIVDTEMMVMRDKRHVASTTMATIVLAVATYAINWYLKHGM